MSNTIFGYGSLILPTSLIMKFENFDENTLYDDNTSYIMFDELLNIWENEYSNRIKYIPVKLHGFKRYYSYNSEHGNNKLEIYKTNNESDYINGVLFNGLTDNEVSKVTEYELRYDFINIDINNFEKYYKNDNLNSFGNKIGLYLSEKNLCDINADNPKNEIYHQRIQKGIEMLGNKYSEEIVKEFKIDFYRTTYEANNGTFETLFNNYIY